jgi:hypothetical protein
MCSGAGFFTDGRRQWGTNNQKIGFNDWVILFSGGNRVADCGVDDCGYIGTVIEKNNNLEKLAKKNPNIDYKRLGLDAHAFEDRGRHQAAVHSRIAGLN